MRIIRPLPRILQVQSPIVSRDGVLTEDPQEACPLYSECTRLVA